MNPLDRWSTQHFCTILRYNTLFSYLINHVLFTRAWKLYLGSDLKMLSLRNML